MTPLYIDFETRSPVDLKTAGLARYSRHPQTEALMMAYVWNEPEPMLWEPGMPLDPRIADHVKAGGLVVAHNAQFELAIWNNVMTRQGWPRLEIAQTRCTMAACYAQALPGALENAAHALGLAVEKDTQGRSLMLKMCKPRGLANGKYVYHEEPEQIARLGEYCKQDVKVEREIYKRVMALPDFEQRLWELDQKINLRGIPVDMASVVASMRLAEVEKKRLNGEMAKVTSGAVLACSALPALKAWAADYGVMPASLGKAELNELLGNEILPEPVEAALRLRLAAGRFTSISKLNSIDNRQIDSRVMYTFQYHAATTGRWAGRGIQPHNFTRDLPKPADVEDILAHIRVGDARYIDVFYGEPSTMISKCLRGFIHAAPGKKLMGGDFSNVEGRGIAWQAGEEWKVQAFRECDENPNLPDMYVRAYAKTFGVPPLLVTKDQRQIGKVEELAFGYQGGVSAFRTMAKAYGIRVVETSKAVEEVAARGGKAVTEAQADEFKQGWRSAHPKIVQYWEDLHEAAKEAVRRPGEITTAGAPGREVRFRVRGSFLWCRLPSGRNLCYPYPEIRTAGQFDLPSLTFKGVPDQIIWSRHQALAKTGTLNGTYIVDDPTNTNRWCRIATYGGKLAENVTQAICRDLLAGALARVEEAGFPVVLHVHDEIVCEGDFTEADLKQFEQLMTEVPAWAKGFPIAAGCWLSPRYIKG